MQFPGSPADVFAAANERIPADTFSDQFVTVFYGVIDTHKQTLTYANAGHNPAYLLGGNGRSPHHLQQTIPDAIHTFTGDAPQFNDIMLLILQRQGE